MKKILDIIGMIALFVALLSLVAILGVGTSSSKISDEELMWFIIIMGN